MEFKNIYKIIEEKFDDCELEDEFVIRIYCISGYDIIVEQVHDKYDIYVDLSVDYNHPIAEYENSLHRMVYVLWVAKRARDLPLYLSEGNIKLGYFDVCQDEVKIIEIINSLYEEVDLDMNFINDDIVFLQTHYPEVYPLFEYYKELYENDLLDNLSEDTWVHISADKSVSERFDFCCKDKVYINKVRTMLCGIGEDTLKKVIENLGEPSVYISEEYTGLNYSFCKTDKSIIVYDNKLLDSLKAIFNDMSIPSYYGIDYMINEHSIYFVMSGSMWGVVLPMKCDCEEKIYEERNTLFYRLNSLKNFMPNENTLLYYDFEKIGFSEFEKMCYDLLIELGFSDLKIRGKSTTPDGGVDIEAYEEYGTLIGKEKRYWLIQCKHTKSQINRKDISELDDLLSEFRADKFGIFYSGIFTPATLDRIKTKSFVYTWDLNQISFLLNKYPKVSKKYFGI